MQVWNRDALVSLTAQLKENVIMSHGLSDELEFAAGGFMSPGEAQAVLSRPNNAEQMGELIRILRGKTDADFITFCQMLRSCNYGMWANQLEGKASVRKVHIYYSVELD